MNKIPECVFALHVDLQIIARIQDTSSFLEGISLPDVFLFTIPSTVGYFIT